MGKNVHWDPKYKKLQNQSQQTTRVQWDVTFNQVQIFCDLEQKHLVYSFPAAHCIYVDRLYFPHSLQHILSGTLPKTGILLEVCQIFTVILVKLLVTTAVGYSILAPVLGEAKSKKPTH